MEIRILDTLKDKYHTSSWALWSSDFPETGCVEENSEEFYQFIRRNQDKLYPSVVLLSLNPSTELPKNYQNFHSTHPKHRNNQLRKLIEHSNLEGAYMTDLVERIVEADSARVDPKNADVENLLEQLDLLNQDSYHVICFHRKVFQTLADFFNSTPRKLPHDIRRFTARQNGRRLDCYRVWFHANWGSNKNKIPELQDQLNYISSEIIGDGHTDLSYWNK